MSKKVVFLKASPDRIYIIRYVFCPEKRDAPQIYARRFRYTRKKIKAGTINLFPKREKDNRLQIKLRSVVT